MRRGLLFLTMTTGAACVPAGNFSGQLAVEAAGEVAETSRLGLRFDTLAEQYAVPSDLLKALAYVETGLEPAQGGVEFEGQAPWFGYFGLRGASLERAARLVGHSVDEVIGDEALGIEAAAALLAALGDEAAVSPREDPAAWAPALARWGEHDGDMQPVFVGSVLRVLGEGAAVPMEDGTTLVIRRYGLGDKGALASTARGLDARGAVWRPSPNHSARGSRPEMVIIHTCEGAYSGCVSWLRNTASGVSAHYVIKEDGSEVSQLVDEGRKAWHVAARYRRALNGNQLSAREGQSINDFAIGIEHGGSESQRSFPTGQINRSIELVRDITARNNIPRDRYHIVGHGRLQPETRSDPGPNWPWTSYLQSISGGATTPTPTPPPTPTPSGTVITVDNGSSARFRASAAWESSSWAAGRVGSDYRFRSGCGRADPAEFKVNVAVAGRYEVFTRVPGNGYSTDAPFAIRHRGGTTVVRRDLSRAGASWQSLGTYDFAAGDDWIVAASCWTDAAGFVIADAVQLEPR